MSTPTVDKGLALFNSIPPPPFDVIHPHNERLIARVGQNQIFIKDRRKKELLQRGINVPPFLRERFNNASFISDDDPFFYEAFITAQCWHFLRDGYVIRKT